MDTYSYIIFVITFVIIYNLFCLFEETNLSYNWSSAGNKPPHVPPPPPHVPPPIYVPPSKSPRGKGT